MSDYKVLCTKLDLASRGSCIFEDADACIEAIASIEQLQADNARLRAEVCALHDWADEYTNLPSGVLFDIGAWWKRRPGSATETARIQREERNTLREENGRLRADIVSNDKTIAELRKSYEEGLEAWKKNNEFFGGWCERLAAIMDIYVTDFKTPTINMLDVRAMEAALAEYKAARVGR